MTLSENKCPSFHSLGQGIFLSVSSISCQHGSLRGADAEVGEKCSLSRLIREPSHDGLVLPATFPQDALTTCQRAIWHLHPGASQIARSSTGRSSFLPRLRCSGARGSQAHPESHLFLATHRKEERSGHPLPPASSLVGTEPRNLFKPLQSLARDRLCSLLIALNLISKCGLEELWLRLTESTHCARHYSKCFTFSRSSQPYFYHLNVTNEESERRHI